MYLSLRQHSRREPKACDHQHVEQSVKQQEVPRDLHSICKRRHGQFRQSHADQNQAGCNSTGGQSAPLSEEQNRIDHCYTEEAGHEPEAAVLKQRSFEIAPTGE